MSSFACMCAYWPPRRPSLWPAACGTATSATPPGEEIAESAADHARWGDWSGRGLPGCGQCHAPDGNGIGSHFPGIAGQHASYIKAQLLAWKSGARANDPLGLMKVVSDGLTDAEVASFNSYRNFGIMLIRLSLATYLTKVPISLFLLVVLVFFWGVGSIVSVKTFQSFQNRF